jgi:hypothetical protein
VLFDPHVVLEIFFFDDTTTDGDGTGSTQVEITR